MQNLGFGREGCGLRLHGRVDDDLREVGRPGRAGAGRDVQAILNERNDPVLADALAPSGDRRTIERQVVAKELFAAEQLIIGVFHPTLELAPVV